MIREIVYVVISLLVLNVPGMAREDIYVEDTDRHITNINPEITELKEDNNKYSIDLKGGTGGRVGGRIGGRTVKIGGGKVSPKTYSVPKSPKVSTGTKSPVIKESITTKNKYSEFSYRPSPMLPITRSYTGGGYNSFYPFSQNLFPNYYFMNSHRNNTNSTW